MPRPLRIHVPDGFYHVTLRGNHQQPIFRRDCERTLLNIIVARAIDKFRARLHAYCWMTNHLHMLVQVGEFPLGKVVQQVASQYARSFQSSLATTGHLFENRYHATLIDTDAYLLEALRYVHQNPVRAGIVSAVSQYPWSSHAAYAHPGARDLVTTDFALSLLSQDRSRAIVRYRGFVDQLPPAAIAAELEALEQGAPLLGGEAFVARHQPIAQVSAALESVIAEACRHFGVARAELSSPRRTARLVAARTWVTGMALDRRITSLANIARALNRDESSLRAAIRPRSSQGAPEFSPPDTTNPAAARGSRFP